MEYGFLCDLDARLVEDCYWDLNHSLWYNSPRFGMIEVKKGFQTDLASVPRVPIVYELWGNSAHREAVLHDFVYRYDSEPHLTFMQANYVFLEAMKLRRVPFYIRYPMYLGVCAGGIVHFGRYSYKDKIGKECEVTSEDGIGTDDHGKMFRECRFYD